MSQFLAHLSLVSQFPISLVHRVVDLASLLQINNRVIHNPRTVVLLKEA